MNVCALFSATNVPAEEHIFAEFTHAQLSLVGLKKLLACHANSFAVIAMN